MDIEARRANFLPGTPHSGANLHIKAPRGAGDRGALIAWDVGVGKPVWTMRSRCSSKAA
jgi:hypothetical protein